MKNTLEKMINTETMLVTRITEYSQKIASFFTEIEEYNEAKKDTGLIGLYFDFSQHYKKDGLNKEQLKAVSKAAELIEFMDSLRLNNSDEKQKIKSFIELYETQIYQVCYPMFCRNF